jgi:hypothetical protein
MSPRSIAATTSQRAELAFDVMTATGTPAKSLVVDLGHLFE